MLGLGFQPAQKQCSLQTSKPYTTGDQSKHLDKFKVWLKFTLKRFRAKGEDYLKAPVTKVFRDVYDRLFLETKGHGEDWQESKMRKALSKTFNNATDYRIVSVP